MYKRDGKNYRQHQLIAERSCFDKRIFPHAEKTPTDRGDYTILDLIYTPWRRDKDTHKMFRVHIRIPHPRPGDFCYITSLPPFFSLVAIMYTSLASCQKIFDIFWQPLKPRV